MTDAFGWAEPDRGRQPDDDGRGRLGPGGKLLVLLIVLVFLGGILAAGVTYVTHRLQFGSTSSSDYAGPGTGRVVVTVPQGASATDIGRLLAARGVVESSGAFVGAASNDARSTSIQPGPYALASHMSAHSALALLIDPGNLLVTKVTIPEGTSIKKVLPLLAKATSIPVAALQAAAAKPSTLGLPSYAGGSPEGFLFPATYSVPTSTSATALLKQLTARFAVIAKSAGLVPGSAALGYTPRQVVIIASIIERESAAPADAPRVARVFYNRLKAGLPLGSEFTVAYAGNDKTSPYNTYTHTGFPPGPYDSPGQATLTAALHPAVGDWKFFVTLPKEGTKFVTTENEFAQLSAQCRAEGGCK